MYHFCVRICIQLQHKSSSKHQWYKLWGGRIYQYKLPLCMTLAPKNGVGVYSRVCLYSEIYDTIEVQAKIQSCFKSSDFLYTHV